MEIIMNIVLSILNLFTLVVSVYIASTAADNARSAARNQEIHNKNSVRPILQLELANYEDDIYVKIMNKGVGPGTIDSLSIAQNHRNIRKDIISFFDRYQWEWDAFDDYIEGKTIAPGQSICLIEMKDPSSMQREIIRAELGKIGISFKYEDIYDRSFTREYDKLDLFIDNPASTKRKQSKRSKGDGYIIHSDHVNINHRE